MVREKSESVLQIGILTMCLAIQSSDHHGGKGFDEVFKTRYGYDWIIDLGDRS